MNKSDLIEALAKKNNLTEKQATDIVNLMIDGFTNELKNVGRIEIRGFGSFVIKKRAKKIGRHIKQNKSIEIPEHFIPSFKPAKVFVEEVKNKVTSMPDDESDD